MPDMPKVGVEAVVEGMSKYVSDAQNFNQTTSGMGGAAQSAASALGDLGGLAAGALAAGLAVAAAGVAALGTALVFSVGQALENEQTLARLDTVIKSTGGAAGLTSEEAQKLAQQFTGLAGGSDDAILAIEEMALRMGTVSKDQMPAFIQTTLDLAAATGQDAVGAARLLAQAQEDPISALGRFRRMGILFTDQQQEQIKTLVKAGDTAGAAALVMDRLAEATGGAAQAQANTLAGQWKILQGTIGEAAESIGMTFLPVLHELFDSVIAPAIPIITEFGNAIGTAFSILLGGDIGGAFDALMEFDSVRAVFQGLGIDVYSIGGIVEDFVANAQTQFSNLITFIQPVIGASQNLAAAFIASMPMIQQTVANMVTFVQGLIEQFAPTIVADVTTALNEMAAFWTAHGAQIMAIVQITFEFIAVTIGTTITLVSGLIAAGMQAINGDWSGAWTTIQNTLTTSLNAILGIVGTDLDSFIASWQGTFALAETIVSTVFNNIVAGIQAKVGELVAAALNAANSAIAAIRGAFGMHSPSKVGIEIGQNVIQSIAAGMASMASIPAQAAASVVAGATYSTSMSNTYNYAPTYGATPVSPVRDFAVMQALAQ